MLKSVFYGALFFYFIDTELFLRTFAQKSSNVNFFL